MFRRVIVGLCVAASVCAQARVVRFEVTKRAPAYGGRAFGATGAYEQIDGLLHGELDPRDAKNAVITDLAVAPRNARGLVEYTTEVSILRPVSGGNHILFYDVVNRGGRMVTGLFNLGSEDGGAGDGWLERRGYTLVFSGWQADLPETAGKLRLEPVVAHGPKGQTITGRVRAEWNLNAPIPSGSLGSGTSIAYPAASLDNSSAVLTRRVHALDPKEKIPNADWTFADCRTKPFPGEPNPRMLCLKGGLDANHLYELVYTAKDPILVGIGFAATRDLVEWLRSDTSVANPLANSIRSTLLHGTSQSGRWARQYLQLGFNQGEHGSRIFDGMNPHVGPVRGAFNLRFGQPGRLAGLAHQEHDFPGTESPVSYAPSDDPLTGTHAGLLDRCTATRTCPKIVHTLSETEFWQMSASADTTDAVGKRDLPQPDNVRIYVLAGTQHSGWPARQALPEKPAAGCQMRLSPNTTQLPMRAILVALEQWVVSGTMPPASVYPRIDAGQLVAPEAVRFPKLPGVTFNAKQIFHQRAVYDRGRGFDALNVSGSVTEPPVEKALYPALAPQVDSDGNSLGGLKTLTMRVPLGTYTGWNVRVEGHSGGDSCDLNGGWVPFARTRNDRIANADTRLSLKERYGSHAAYVNAVRQAADAMVKERFLLPEDAVSAVQWAESSNILQ